MRSHKPPQRSQYFNSSSMISELCVSMIASPEMNEWCFNEPKTKALRRLLGHRARFSYDDLVMNI
jgi:hypothetical protein